MIKKRYSSRVPVFVTGGVLLTGMVWFARMDWNIRGEDVAELRAAVEERRAPFLFGHSHTSLPQASLAWCVVVEDTSGGKIHVTNGLENSPVEFTADNYFIGRPVGVRVDADAPTGSYFEAAWYLDGNIQTGRMVVSVGAPPPGGPRYMGSIGDLTLNWRRLELAAGVAGDNYVRLNEAPRRREREALVTERVAKAQVYDGVLAEARALALAGDGAPGVSLLPAVFWLAGDGDVKDGDILCRYASPSWQPVYAYTNEDGSTHTDYALTQTANEAVADGTETTVSRAPRAGAVCLPGVSEKNAPFCRRLYSGTPANLHSASGGTWWDDIGNGITNYRYACEDTNGAYAAYTIRRRDLDQAANVLTNLKRTLALLPLDYLKVESHGVMSGYGLVQTDLYSAGFPGSDLQPFVDEAHAEAAAGAQSAFSSPAWDGSLAAYAMNASRDARFYVQHQHWRERISAQVSFQTHTVGALLTNYPCALYLTNGAIDRIRVFGCVYNTADPAINLLMAGYGLPADPDVEVERHITGDYSAVQQAAVWSLIGGGGQGELDGMDLNLPLHQPSEAATARYIISGDPPPAYTLWLLDEISEPDDIALPVSFGSAQIEAPGFHTWAEATITHTYPDGTTFKWGDEEWVMNFQSKVKCLAVVIDWNWEHMNPASPYEPTPHTPEWLSTNTP